MIEQPLVSVVLPVYNGARFLQQAVESVFEQTYAHIEILAIDDGSTDDSEKILHAFGNRISVVRQANAGVAAARNRGVRAARGEFVAFLDQDDWWLPTKIAKQVSAFAADPNVDLVHTGVAHFRNATGTFVGRLNPNTNPGELVGSCYERLLQDNSIYNTTVMVRRSAVEAVGGFDTTIEGNTVADYDLWLRLARASRFAFIPEELAVFRIHESQGTWKRQDMLNAELRLISAHAVDETRRSSTTLRRRFADLKESIGIAYLDARDDRKARQFFREAFRERPSFRRFALVIASFMPAAVLSRIRNGDSVRSSNAL